MLVAITFTSGVQGSQDVDGIPRITVDELKAKIDKHEEVLVVDVRTHLSSKIKGAVHISYTDISKNLDKLPTDRLIVTVCACFNEATSGSVVQFLKEKGYTKVVALKGGQQAWETAQYPTEIVKEEMPTQ